MQLTASQVSALKPTSKRQRFPVASSLLLIVESESRGGGKSFVGALASHLDVVASR